MNSEIKIKKILVSQPNPENGKSPYFELAEQYNLQVDFRPFIHVEGIPAKEFRQERIDILGHTAVIFTSKTAVDNFFRICEELRLCVPDSMKYFCISESVAFYLQKYIVYRKRKIFYGNGQFSDTMDMVTKHKEEKFLVPLSDNHKDEIPTTLKDHKIKFTKAIIYRTVCSNLSDLVILDYDMLVFFSPSGIKSLMQNFPDFKQNSIKIASFGATTASAVEQAGLRLDVRAPLPEAPSMTMALDLYIKSFNKNSRK
jgi:uroporphyrinogen-III synthase